jgi:hypothetical protein
MTIGEINRIKKSQLGQSKRREKIINSAWYEKRPVEIPTEMRKRGEEIKIKIINYECFISIKIISRLKQG